MGGLLWRNGLFYWVRWDGTDEEWIVKRSERKHGERMRDWK